MPFGSMMRPSLALGLLKSELAAIDVPVSVENFALGFAGLIGEESYLYLSDQAPPALLAGEWVFAACLFGDDPARVDAFERHARSFISAAELELIRGARSQAESFLRGCLDAVDWAANDVVGFTTTFAQNVASLALARRVKELSPGSVVVFGGANCEGEMGLALQRSFPFVDIVCAGEADLTFPRLLETLRVGGEPAEIPGVIARNGYSNLSPERVRDLDELPYPDFDEFFEQSGRRRVVVMETARGCWWGDKHHCTFCGIDFPAAYRSKSPARALAEVIALRDAYEVRAFVMTDEILDMRYFRDFVPALAELQEPVSIFYETKANLTKHQLGLLADGGIRQLQPGIESFSTRLLGLVDKGVSAAQNVQLLKWCEELGIEPRWNVLYGVPGEEPCDYADAAATVDAVAHLCPPQGCGPIRLDRFSPYHADPAAFGLVNVRPSGAYRLVYDLPDDALAGLAYYFDFEFADGRDPADYTGELREAIARWRARRVPGGLTYSDDGETVTIVDRRGEGAEERELSGWRRDVYLYCDESRPRARVERLALGQGARAGELRWFLVGLIESRSMIELDGRLLSLAVRAGEDALAASGAERRRGFA
jgi:ribosomal peptide maturation radical SAM protein 1